MPVIQGPSRRPPLSVLLGFVLFLSIIVGYTHFGTSRTGQFTLAPFKAGAIDGHFEDASSGGDNHGSSILTSQASTPAPGSTSTTTAIPTSAGESSTEISPATPTTSDAETPWASTAAYIQAIMDPSSNTVPRLDCPSLDTPRYTYLKPSHGNSTADDALSYLFALDLQTVESLLPRLLGSVVEVIRFIGVGNCLLSIVEGPNEDHTSDILRSLSPVLTSAGIAHEFVSSNLDTKEGGDRIGKLAELRNKALEPLTQPTSPYTFTSDATVVFLNDVAICPNDILELVHQKQELGAVMTCAMDWTYAGRDPTFYDVWVARTMAGDTFFNIPKDGSWDEAWHLFWNDAETRERFTNRQPFQVFSCWNGAVAFTSRAVVGEDAVKFRKAGEDECNQGEPLLFCKDLWVNGMGRIAVVPTVNLEYSDEKGTLIKAAKGYTSQWTGMSTGEDMKIDWVFEPPDMVMCMPGNYSKQEWREWYEGLD